MIEKKNENMEERNASSIFEACDGSGFYAMVFCYMKMMKGNVSM